MQTHPKRADAPALRSALRGLAVLVVLAMAAIPGHALWTGDAVTAFRVADKSIKIDGRPDTVWRAIAVYSRSSAQTISFQDTRKMVLLQPERVRNEDPAIYVPNPVNGSVNLLAAYDSEAMYFFFLVQTKATVANPTASGSSALSCADADLWKADAAEIYVDPSPWSDDPLMYRSNFTADASGLVFGTSPKTIQVDKPISHFDSTRYFHRNRLTGDRFQVPAAANPGILAVSSRSAATTPSLRGVEMKIPFWTPAENFAPGKSMFLAWGFNLYMDSLWANCGGNPLGYRWTKHYINYDAESEKPPGWHAKDSTHYDPVRSWDGWGRLALNPQMVDAKGCRFLNSDFNTNWSLASWYEACQLPTTPVWSRSERFGIRLDAAGMPIPSGLGSRDARGRSLSPGSRAPSFLR